MMPYDDNLSALTVALIEGRLDDPFAFLGRHPTDDGMIVRTFQPGAESVSLVARDGGSALGALEDQGGGLFVGRCDGDAPYLLSIAWPGGTVQETEDAYAFGPFLGDLDLHLFNEGRHWDLGRVFGAQPKTVEGVAGVGSGVV